jgi:hypothetical protein
LEIPKNTLLKTIYFFSNDSCYACNFLLPESKRLNEETCF